MNAFYPSILISVHEQLPMSMPHGVINFCQCVGETSLEFVPMKILPPSGGTGQAGATTASLQTPLVGLAHWTIHGATYSPAVGMNLHNKYHCALQHMARE